MGTVPTPEHPLWCDRDHADEFPMHTAEIGDVYADAREFGVQVQQPTGRPVAVALFAHDDEETTLYSLSPAQARALAGHLVAGADLAESRYGAPTRRDAQIARRIVSADGQLSEQVLTNLSDDTMRAAAAELLGEPAGPAPRRGRMRKLAGYGPHALYQAYVLGRRVERSLAADRAAVTR